MLELCQECDVQSLQWRAHKGQLDMKVLMCCMSSDASSLLEALESRRTNTLRYVDIYSLGAAMPDETLWHCMFYIQSVTFDL